MSKMWIFKKNFKHRYYYCFHCIKLPTFSNLHSNVKSLSNPLLILKFKLSYSLNSLRSIFWLMTEKDISIHKKGLTVGTKAPNFETLDIDNNNVGLSNLLKTHKGVLIDFFRGNWWTHWKEHFKNVLIPNYDEFEKRNIKLISIAVDSPRKMKILQEKYEIPFQFIADRDAKITKSYNVYLTEEHPDYDQFQINHAIPSKFLINKEGIVVWQYFGTKDERPTIEILLEAIEKKL